MQVNGAVGLSRVKIKLCNLLLYKVWNNIFLRNEIHKYILKFIKHNAVEFDIYHINQLKDKQLSGMVINYQINMNSTIFDKFIFVQFGDYFKQVVPPAHYQGEEIVPIVVGAFGRIIMEEVSYTLNPNTRGATSIPIIKFKDCINTLPLPVAEKKFHKKLLFFWPFLLGLVWVEVGKETNYDVPI
ncbi:hypothetical protein DICPUDRAFT_79200 [Dictyostelium purpureum]|uniref:Uncharacterized protein n=1 Tax=Dictyostelium purpureum TaxID=5786 RepID=F0ZLV5_DICPU|nr:uncharacterized protein DICPUDRAFT_79200 [Dictyostelium purpureum]EGC35095.1 hypothetical protein DICPUDRAFT_79200 [Dictyostelium purpureum]|eukprot:XP_003288402.1 hypothetical protein DICPUDRAFT_79200 [Dictyostelium purpureum]